MCVDELEPISATRIGYVTTSAVLPRDCATPRPIFIDCVPRMLGHILYIVILGLAA